MEIAKNAVGKWLATGIFASIRQSSPPLKTKREAEAWLVAQQLKLEIGDSTVLLMSAAIIKGLTEKQDGMAYFGSTLNYTGHLANAIEFGYVTKTGKVTKRGQEWYARCLKQLPQTRQVFWGMHGGIGMPDQTVPTTGGTHKQKKAEK